VINLIGGALKRKSMLGHKSLRRVHPRGMSEAVAQEILQDVAEVRLEDLALL